MSISLPNRLTGSCRILVIFNVILLSFIIRLMCDLFKSTSGYLFFNKYNKSSIVIVLFFFNSCNKKSTYSFFTLYATGFL